MDYRGAIPGATTREESVVRRLHRVSEAEEDASVRSVLGEALELLVELIKGRRARQDLHEQMDRQHEDA